MYMSETEKNVDKEISELETKSNRNYSFILVSQFLSLIGSSVVQFALIWYITIFTGSPLYLGISTLAIISPIIFLGPVTGTIADRYSKKALIFLSDGIQALSILFLFTLFSLQIQSIWIIVGTMLIMGIANAVQVPIQPTIMTSMVVKDYLPKFNALIAIGNTIIALMVPVFSVFLLSFYPIQYILLVDTITVIPAFTILLFINIPKTQIENKSKTFNIRNDFKDSVNFIKDHGMLFVIFLFASSNFLINPLFNLLPLLITQFHGGTLVEFGLVEVLFQFGFFLGAIYILVKGNKNLGSNHLMKAGFAYFLLTFFLAIAPQGNFLPINIILFLLGLAIAFVDIQFLSFFQTNTPEHMQGRVFSFMFMFTKSFYPLGVFVTSGMVELFSIENVYFLNSIIIIILFLLVKKRINAKKIGKLVK